MKKLLFLILFLFFSVFFISCIATFIVHSNTNFSTSSNEYYYSTQEYTWPIPNYHNISSYFGYRISPITGLPSKHSGIDIPAPERN